MKITSMRVYRASGPWLTRASHMPGLWYFRDAEFPMTCYPQSPAYQTAAEAFDAAVSYRESVNLRSLEGVY